MIGLFVRNLHEYLPVNIGPPLLGVPVDLPGLAEVFQVQVFHDVPFPLVRAMDLDPSRFIIMDIGKILVVPESVGVNHEQE